VVTEDKDEGGEDICGAARYQILILVGVFTEFEKCGDTRSVERES
jgi:hypothetical protein